MPEITIDAAGVNESPSTPSVPAESTPAAVAAPQAARKPAKRSAAPKAAQVTAEAATVAPAKIAKIAKPAKPGKAAAPARAVKAPKVSKAVAALPVKSVKPVKPVKVAKPVKPTQPAPLPEVTQPKPRLVRDSFTIPELEYAQLEALKRRSLALAHHVKKSELLRAGIATLAAMGDAQLLAALQSVPPLKTGRPKKPKADKVVGKIRNGGKKS